MSLLGGVGEQLNFVIDLNADSAIREAKKFGDTVEKETKKSEDSLSKFSRSAATFGVGATAFGGALLAGLGKAVVAYSDAEKQHLKLTTAIDNSNQSFSKNGKAVADAAQHLQTYTAVEGDAAEAGAAMLVQFGLTERQVKDLLPLVGDLSRRLGIDMEDAAKKVGKAASGEGVGALSKMGIVIDETAYKTDAFGSTVKALNDTVGGFAKGEAATAAGKIEMLKNNLQDIEEGVGAGAADVLGAVVGPLADLATSGGAAGDSLERIGKVGAVLGAGSVIIGGLSLAASWAAKLKANLTDATGELTTMGIAAKGLGMAGAAFAVYQLAQQINEATKNTLEFDTATKKFDQDTTFKDKTKDLRDMAEGSKGVIDNISDWLPTFRTVAPSAEVAIGGVKIQIDDLKRAIDNTGDSTKKLERVKVALEGLGTGKLSFADNQLRDWLKDQETQLQKNIDVTAKGEKKTKDLAKAQEDAAESSKKFDDALKPMNGALGLYELAAGDAGAAAKGFADAIEAVDTDERVTSSLKLNDALKGVRDTVGDLPPKFSEALAGVGAYNDEQSKALKSLTDWGDAAKGQIDALIQSGAASDVVKAKTGDYRKALEDVMKQAGFTKGQIEEYQRILGLTDPQIDTALTISGDVEAKWKLQLYNQDLVTLTADQQTWIRAEIDQGHYDAAWNDLNKFKNPITVPVNPELQPGTVGYQRLKDLGFVKSGPAAMAAVPMSVGPAQTAATTVQPVPVPITINVNAGIGDPAEIGRKVIDAIKAAERVQGSGWRVN